MNIKDPLNPYIDDRKEQLSKHRKDLIKRKLVHQCNYELVMGHVPHKTTMSLSSTKPRQLPRTNDATLNGRSLR